MIFIFKNSLIFHVLQYMNHVYTVYYFSLYGTVCGVCMLNIIHVYMSMHVKYFIFLLETALRFKEKERVGGVELLS